MPNFDYYMIGPISLDYDEYADGTVKRLIGGPMLYSAYAALAGGWEIGAAAKIGEADAYITQPFYIKNLTLLPDTQTTVIRVVYFSDNRDERTLQLESMSTPICAAELPDVQSKVFQLLGTVNGHLDNDLFPYLAARGKVACDLQGYVRYRNGSTIEFRDWAEKEQYLPYITYLKCDTMEAKIVTGTDDMRTAAQKLYNWGAREILITGNQEVLVYDGHEFTACPLRPRSLIGRSGRGDTTFGSYVTERQRASIPEALLYATAMVSLKMQYFGPFKGSRQDVQRFIAQAYPDFQI